MQTSRNPFGGLRLALLIFVFTLIPLGFSPGGGVEANQACGAGTGVGDNPCTFELDSVCTYGEVTLLDRYLRPTP